LRSQVASLSETHVFSSGLVNRMVFGFSRAAFLLDSGTTVDLPAWIHPGQPVGAVTVGGGATLNGITNFFRLTRTCLRRRFARLRPAPLDIQG